MDVVMNEPIGAIAAKNSAKSAAQNKRKCINVYMVWKDGSRKGRDDASSTSGVRERAKDSM